MLSKPRSPRLPPSNRKTGHFDPASSLSHITKRRILVSLLELAGILSRAQLCIHAGGLGRFFEDGIRCFINQLTMSFCLQAINAAITSGFLKVATRFSYPLANYCHSFITQSSRFGLSLHGSSQSTKSNTYICQCYGTSPSSDGRPGEASP